MGRYEVKIFAEPVEGGSPILLHEFTVDSIPIERTLSIRFNLEKNKYKVYAVVKDRETGVEVKSNEVEIKVYEMDIRDVKVSKTEVKEGEVVTLTALIERI